MKKLAKILLFVFAFVGVLAITACNRNGDNGNGGNDPGPGPGPGVDVIDTAPPEAVDEDDNRLARHGLELAIVDGEEVLRFIETQPLTAATWNRPDTERNPSIADSNWGDWIRAEMLRVHNVDITLVEIPRWQPSEEETLAALLAANTAPDVSYTFSFSTIQTFADMGGVLDLTPIVAEYMDFIPNLYTLWGMEHLTWNLNHDTGQTWAFTGNHPDSDLRNTTFVREDWLNTLGIAPPTTLQEFEDMLVAFRDNAELLLGADADQMIPFRLTEDVGWTGDLIFSSFIPNSITDRDWYIYGFCDRRFTQPGVVEGVRLLNRWYNMDLLWDDFFLHTGGDPRGNDLVRLGFVGSLSVGWDSPFRPGDGLITQMQENIGPHANFIAISPFANDAGVRQQFVPHGTDRHVFFPRSNDNIAASLLYLDWLARPSTRAFLMFGPEGYTHEIMEDGAIRTFAPEEIEDDRWIWQVARNYDLLFIMGHAVNTGDPEVDALALAFGYPGIEPWRIMQSREANLNYARVMGRAVIPTPQAQIDFGSPGLNNFARSVLNQAVRAAEGEFDTVWNDGMRDYLAMGGQAIIDGRRAAWLEVYGDVDWVPVD
ncbi:MAG: hypothetical protein FWC71_09585 [Defluviitaleaceae bacterium]|nr:hypothetical protein [Defluviitaleaceae bacterium]